MIKPKKTKTGKWTAQVYLYTDKDGKKVHPRVTADTKQELLLKIALLKNEMMDAKPSQLTVREAIDRYIELRPTLSPATLTGYDKMKRFAFQDIMDMKVSDLDDIKIQEAVNRECSRISERTGKPISIKTVKNEYGLLSSALKTVCKKTFTIGKLEHQKHLKEYPEVSDVIKALHGTAVELPCMLALWLTFSMSEIRGIKCSDIKDGCVTINRVIVDTNKGAVVKENAKVDTRLRKHEIPPYLMELINNTKEYQKYLQTGEDGFLITRERGAIYREWKGIAKNMGYNLTFHDLRHLSASCMVFLGIPQRYMMERGGWKSPSIMQSVYQHTLTDERKMFDQVVNDYFEKNIPK